jgi:tetratricopeptide (TPR) repeat protein
MNRRKDRNTKGKASRPGDRPRSQSDAAARIPPARGRVRAPIACAATVCGLLLLAVIVVFGQTASHGFVNFDDGTYVHENRHVLVGLTGEGITWAFTAFHADNWHPLTWLSHMLDCQLYNLEPGGHHLTNVLLHAVAAVLLFLVLRRMTGALWPSAWVAAVFAIHPLRVESVAWVAERKDVLSGLFFMLTVWLYARYADRPASWGRYMLVMASFALGLMAKPMLVTLPLVLLLLDYWPLGRFSQRRVGGAGKSSSDGALREPAQNTDERFQGSDSVRNPPVSLRFAARTLQVLVVEKIPLFVLAAASCVVTLSAQRGAISSLERLPIPWRVAQAAVAYAAYIGKMLFPAGLAVLYPLPKGPPPAWEVVAAVTMLLAISAAVFVARKKCPYLLFGWLWYLGTLLPVIGLVQVGSQAMADRYTYLTQIGLYAAIAWGAMHLAGSRPDRRWAFAAVATLLVTGLMACAWQQASCWRDSETLWTHTLACTSQNSTAHTNLGLALVHREQVDEAMAHFRMALEIEPDFVQAHNNLGKTLAGRGQVDEAITHYRQALEINPDEVKVHVNLGDALAGRGQVDEAMAHYRKALEIKPDDAEAHNSLGNALARRGQVDEAMAHYRKALEIKPDFELAHNAFGVALAGRGQVDEAIAHYRKALEIKPGFADAHNNLGNALVGRGQVEEAIAHYRKALEI